MTAGKTAFESDSWSRFATRIGRNGDDEKCIRTGAGDLLETNGSVFTEEQDGSI